jgi:hypothetical protein
MNSENIIKLIVKKADKFESKQKFDDENKFKIAVQDFVDTISSKLVYLELIKKTFKETSEKQSWSLKFRIVFNFESDLYVDYKIYNSGSVPIFPSKKLFTDIDQLSMKLFNAYSLWDESRTIATISGHAKAY